MKKLLVFLTFIPGFIFAQHRSRQGAWHLTVVDSLTCKAIEKITVTVNNLNAFITDENGVVNLKKKSMGLNSNIKFSSIGYNTLQFKVTSDSNLPDTIKLFSSLTSLNEVKIQSAAPVKIAIGETSEKYKGAYYPILNNEMALYIPNEKKLSAIINSVYFFVNDDLKGIEKPFKVQLYTKDKDSLYPDKEMIKDSIIVYNPKKKHKVEVNLLKYNLQIPENGFFIVLKIMSAKWYGNSLVRYGDEYCHRVPGIDRDFVNLSDWGITNDPRVGKGGEYSLIRLDKDLGRSWTTTALGDNFAMGATLIEN